MLPEAFLVRMQQMLGDEFDAFLATFENSRYQALRLNVLKQNESGISAAEGLQNGEGFAHLSPVSWAENGYYYESGDQPGKHPYHEAGVYYIQEPSAMLPAELLQVEPGHRVLDLCAAPGGKSTQIASKLRGKGFLLCNEIHPARAKILSENVERMGIVNACVTNETPAKLSGIFPGYFDRIMVDAPCSGEGMFRKNEAACEEWSPENVTLCANRQDEILDCAAGMLRAGGRMVYSTCTFAEEEDEGSIRRFIERHPEFTIVEQHRLWPHKVKGEGHFAAVLQKAGESRSGFEAVCANGFAKGINEKELAEFKNFCKETLTADALPIENPKYLKFGDNLYMVAQNMPDLKGLKVLRPGLHLGEMKKNRFEPSHALALALAPGKALHHYNLQVENGEALNYLNGQTFPAEGEKGWYLILVNGYSCGWGKLAGGMMKNHYPKGLRVNK